MGKRTNFIRRTRFSKSTDHYYRLWFKYHRLFFNRLISRGKKLIAFNKFIDVKRELKLHEETDPFLVFLVSMIKVSPLIYLLPIRLGRITHGVPLPITEKKKLTLAVGWVVMMSKNKSRTISVKELVNLLVSSIYDQGAVIDRKKGNYLTGAKNRHLMRFFK